MSIPERFWTWWFDGIPQPVADRMFKRVVNEEVSKLAERLAAENRELTRQRDDARDVAIRCGAWQNDAGTDFEAHLEAIYDESAHRPLVDPDGLLFGGAS